MTEDWSDKIKEKYEKLGENPETYVQGFLHTKPLTYWDYIQVDTLLSLQKPRTDFEDEEIFIIYHQVTELIAKLLQHELKQITGDNDPSVEKIAQKMKRINRYTRMLIDSFDVMREGMDYDDYNTFRTALAPASGFQCAQFRYIEVRTTALENLINNTGKERLPESPELNDYFENIYWKDAGYNRKTGKKTLTLRLFEEKYEDDIKSVARSIKGKTLEDKVRHLLHAMDEETKDLLREFDRLYNIEWPLVHLRTAAHYLDSKGENKAATGGSQWKKYLHPQFQQRKFFPELWSAEEKENWARDYVI